MSIKDWKYLKINFINLLYLTFSKVNGYFEEINRNKYFTLVPTNKSKKIYIYEELWSKIRDLFRLITKNSDDYDEKYTKIKFNSDDELLLNKTMKVRRMILVVRAVFCEN